MSNREKVGVQRKTGGGDEIFPKSKHHDLKKYYLGPVKHGPRSSRKYLLKNALNMKGFTSERERRGSNPEFFWDKGEVCISVYNV